MKLFDITLRDGLQSIPKYISFKKKCELATYIYKYYKPNSIEVGSIVSEKLLPQMKDSINLHHYCIENNFKSDLYMLIPNLKSLKTAKLEGVKNFSFITSVSESFQKKNTNKNLYETKHLLENMMSITNKNNKIKLYISCINHCPIEGKINFKNILNEIIFYSKIENIDEFCFSDTCGNLCEKDYIMLINKIIKFIPFEKISLHLHKNISLTETINIINYSQKIGIKKFDVSALNIGGCSMTINENNLNSNIEYNLLFNNYKNVPKFDLFN